MTFCSVDDVKAAINFPTTGAPVSDAIIEEFIIDAEEEIEDIYKTKFGNVEDSGTADGDYSTVGFSDSTKSWTENQYEEYVLWIYSGTGEGQYTKIISNTATKLTFIAVSTQPDATSLYKITKLGYEDEIADGSGNRKQFVKKQPLVTLNELTIDTTSVTPSLVYQDESGKLELGKAGVEASYFADVRRQLINAKYIYGVYPMPRIIKRLCIILAGIRTLISQIAGTYDDFTPVTMPGGFSGSKGEPYTNIREAANNLQGEARGIIYGTQSTGQVSGDFRTGATYRPFALFG